MQFKLLYLYCEKARYGEFTFTLSNKPKLFLTSFNGYMQQGEVSCESFIF